MNYIEWIDTVWKRFQVVGTPLAHDRQQIKIDQYKLASYLALGAAQVPGDLYDALGEAMEELRRLGLLHVDRKSNPPDYVAVKRVDIKPSKLVSEFPTLSPCALDLLLEIVRQSEQETGAYAILVLHSVTFSGTPNVGDTWDADLYGKRKDAMAQLSSKKLISIIQEGIAGASCTPTYKGVLMAHKLSEGVASPRH